MVSLDFSCGVFCASCRSCHYHASCLCDHDPHHSKLQLQLMLHLLPLLLPLLNYQLLPLLLPLLILELTAHSVLRRRLLLLPLPLQI
jgi:hypothetical protein